MMMMLILTRTKELMMMHGKLKQSEAKYSAIRDLMAGMYIILMVILKKIQLISNEIRYIRKFSGKNPKLDPVLSVLQYDI